METKIDYDSENDIIYFYPDEKNVDYSVDYDDVIIDISGNKIVGVEIMNASEKFAGVEEEVTKIKKILESVKTSYMNVTYSQNSISIKLGFISNLPERTREGILIQIPIKKEMILNV